MTKKFFFFLSILILLSMMSNQLHNYSLPFNFCDLKGFTIIDCSPPLLDYDDYGYRNPSDTIKLLNGMIFKPIGMGPVSIGPNVVIFAQKVKIHGKEQIFYKLIIEPESMVYDVIRIR